MLKPKVALQAGEVIDATFMSKRALRQFLEEQIEDAKKQGVLFSLHMKATMMKVSDPKIFGHAVTVYYKDVFEKHGETFKKLGVDPDNGIGDLYIKIKALPDDQRKAIEADIQEVYKKRPPMAMVNSDKGITNLHVPSDIIIDASMPPVIRDSGKMWGPDGKLADTKCVIPDCQLRAGLSRGRRILQEARRLRSEDDGQRAQRRSDGAGGRGVRLARQDLQGAGQRHDPRGGCLRKDAAGAYRSKKATSGACAR